MNIDEMLEKPEGKQIEFKQGFPDGKQVAKTVIAFSNQGGGTIYFGIQDEPRKVVGFDKNQDLIDLEEKLESHVYDLVEPIPAFEITTRYLEDYETHILLLEVSPGKNKPYHFKNQPIEESTYLRVSSSNRKADEITLAELRRQAEGIAYDQTPFGTGAVEDLSKEVFREFVERRKNVRDIPEIEFTESALKKLELVTESAGAVFPTRGGFLVFNEEPSNEFPQSIVRCARFKGTDTKEIIDDKELDGPLLRLPDEVMKFFKRHINRGAKI